MASMRARGVPVSGSNATITPWWVGSAEPALRGKRETSLTASAFAEGRKAGMADELAGPTGSYGHDPVFLPRALHLLGRGHLERPDDHGPRLAGVDDVID